MKALLLQCSKRDLRYKTVAIEVTGQVAAALDVDCFSELCDIAIAVLRPSDREEGGGGRGASRTLNTNYYYLLQRLEDEVEYFELLDVGYALDKLSL